jgi:hypothetical protein
MVFYSEKAPFGYDLPLGIKSKVQKPECLHMKEVPAERCIARRKRYQKKDIKQRR